MCNYAFSIPMHQGWTKTKNRPWHFWLWPTNIWNGAVLIMDGWVVSKTVIRSICISDIEGAVLFPSWPFNSRPALHPLAMFSKVHESSPNNEPAYMCFGNCKKAFNLVLPGILWGWWRYWIMFCTLCGCVVFIKTQSWPLTGAVHKWVWSGWD